MKSICEMLRLRKSTRRSQRAGAALNPSPSLESRVLLATLVAANRLTYQDFDGDDVTVTFSKNILTAGNVNSIFHFNFGNVNGNNNTPQLIERINLVGVAGAAGTTITTVATRHFARGGDSLATIGEIDAHGLDLGAVTLDGDLGRILAGDGVYNTTGLAGLSVKSMGRYGTATGATDLESVIQGNLTSLKVKNDIKGAFVRTFNGNTNAGGDIGSVSIGGSLIGTAAQNSGRVHSVGKMGAVTIGGNVEGGGGSHSGAITTFTDIASVTINGSLIGGSNTYAGTILSDFGGGGDPAGGNGGSIGPVKILGSLLGGSDTAAGTVICESGKLGSVTIGGSVIAGTANASARIYSKFDLGTVSITGSVIGGAGHHSGEIESLLGKLAGVSIGGSLKGGAGELSGAIQSKLDLGAVKIVGDIIGGAGEQSGIVWTFGKLASATVGGSIRGGSAESSGLILSALDAGSVKVTGDVLGSTGQNSGQIAVYGKLSSLSIGGSLIGGTTRLTGRVVVNGELTSATIGGNIIGGNASADSNLDFTGSVEAIRIGTLTLGGSLIGGIDNTSGLYVSNGSIQAMNDIGTLTIKGSVIGNTTNSAHIFARGQAAPPANSDVAIGTLSVAGRVEYGLIRAGATDLGQSGDTNADAQINTVSIGGDWIASNLVAGAKAGNDGVFGTLDDAKITGGVVKDLPNLFSKINSMTVAGEVIGTSFTNDNFGIVAEHLVSLKIGGDVIPLLPGAHSDSLVLLGVSAGGVFRDVWVREI